MKIIRLAFLLLLFCESAFATTVTIIESQSYNSGHLMDVNWQTVATGMGYTATIYPQSTLNTNTWFSTTNILIVSSGVINLSTQAIDTIQSFVSRGGHVFIQTEYLSSYNTNGAFQSITNNLGGSFTWGGTTAGTLAPMQILGSLGTTPNATGGSLSYFWYGDVGTPGAGCGAHIEPFLVYSGLYYGFIFAMPTGNGRMITTCDQDWVNQYASTTGALPLMQNILSNLAIPTYTIAGGSASVTVNNASICSGQPATLTATPSPAGGTYLWSPGGATTQSITVNPAATTSYTVTYSSGGCTATATSTVSVSSPATSSISQSSCGPYTFGGQTLSTSGTYHDTLTNAGGCDSIVTLTLSVHNPTSTTSNQSICYGYTLPWHGQSLTTSGTYRDTLTGAYGCDSILILNLTVNQPPIVIDSQQICNGSSYTWHGTSYNTAGTYIDTVQSTLGCKTVDKLVLTLASSVTTPISASICNGSIYNFYGHNLNTAGTYRDTMTSATGCDSIIVLTLSTVSAFVTPLTASGCYGFHYPFHGQSISTSGTYRDTLTSSIGCDSILVLTYTEDTLPIVRDTTTTCVGHPYVWHGTAYNASGMYLDTVMSTLGCKTLYVLQLTIENAYGSGLTPQTICSGSSYNFYGRTLTATGTYYDTLSTMYGCDSVMSLHLTVVSALTTLDSQAICSGSTYTFAGQTLSTPGTYRDTLPSVAGCDSIIVLTLTVIPTSNTAISQSICSGSTYTFGGQTLSTPGTYIDTLTGAAGCDSIVTLALTVIPVSNTNISQSICSNDTYIFNGQTLSTSGTYTATFTGVAGCDSTVVLTLTVIPTSASSISQSICAGSSYTFGSQVLTAAGTYIDTFTNAVGCDSFVVLTLAVIPTSAKSINGSICNGSTYNFNGQTLSASGTYADTFTNAAGCDSIVTLTLTVVSPSTTQFNQSICSGSSYTFNGQTLSTAGTYTDTLTGAAGCDSIVILTLTVLPVSNSAISQTICGGSYVFGSQTLAASGTYIDTFTSAVGCDSIVTLTLTVLQTSTDSINAAICGGRSYIFHGQTLTAAGIYRDTLTNAVGCDSFSILNLVIAPQPVASFVISPSGIVSLGSAVTVTDQSTNADSILWQLNSRAIDLVSGAQLPITDTGTYCLRQVASTSLGCSDTSMECITVYNNSFYLPNAFTPNNDGVNDYITLYGYKTSMKYLGINVYDRWGEKVFESSDINFQWDGTFRGAKVEPGMYVYTLDVTFLSGTAIHNKGSITVIR